MSTASRPKPWSASQYADFRGITPEAAAQERYKGTGPTYIRASGRIYYDPQDVWDWLDANKLTRTDARAGAA